MDRTLVKSSSIHSLGFEPDTGGDAYKFPTMTEEDYQGAEIQFHAAGCPVRNGKPCDCPGLVNAPSMGSHFATQIRRAKTDDGKPKHPGIKL